MKTAVGCVGDMGSPKNRRKGACTETQGRAEVPVCPSCPPWLPRHRSWYPRLNFSPLSGEILRPPLRAPSPWGASRPSPALGCGSGARCPHGAWAPAEPGSPFRYLAPFRRAPRLPRGFCVRRDAAGGAAAGASRHSDVQSWRRHLTPSLFL